MTKAYILQLVLSLKVGFQRVCVGWQQRPICVRDFWERVLLDQSLISYLNSRGCWGEFPLWGILVRSGCYNKVPQTGWLINNRRLLHTFLEAGSPRSGWQPGQVRALLLVHGQCLFAVTWCGRRNLGALWGLFYKGTNPILEGFTLTT